MKFKEWLKGSLIRQREEQMQQKIEKRNKKHKDQEEERTKAHRRVLAKIAYKDWMQTKVEEDKLKKKKERMVRKQQMLEYGKPGYNKYRYGSARSGRRLESENSSRYINTAHKREQLATGGS